jgi:pyroglutamyl-peptidase
MTRVLLTGFQPYGGRDLNPSAEIVRALDGGRLEGATVHGRLLPVSLAGAREPVVSAIAELRPAVVIGIGLWPGEPVIRLERLGVNRASFEMPDNDGHRAADDPIDADGPVARAATLPLAPIMAALQARGIPARISDTAGTYLCNATLFRALGACETHAPGARCGFVHVPYLPQQVVALLDELRAEGRFELHQRADLASMSLDAMVEAVRTAVSVSLETASRRAEA